MFKFSRPVQRPIYAVLIACLLAGVACKKPILNGYEPLSTEKANDLSDAQLLAIAKKFYVQQRALPQADGSWAGRPVDYLEPDWSKAKYARNSAGEKVIGVPLTSFHNLSNELNLVVKDGVPYGIIKQYLHVTDETSNLEVVSANGTVLAKAIYSTSKLVNSNSKYIIMAEKGQRSKFMNTEEAVELEEVVITPGGGGPKPPVVITYPSFPVVVTPPTGTPQGNIPRSGEDDNNNGGWDAGDFPPQSKRHLPKFKDFMDGYKEINLHVEAAYIKVGGEINQARINSPNDYKNSCAIKVSYALNKAGSNIPEIPGKTKKGADGKNYFYRVGDLAKYLKESFHEQPEEFSGSRLNPAAVKYAMERTEGIYIMRANYSTYGASGHATFVNGREEAHHDTKAAVKIELYQLPK